MSQGDEAGEADEKIQADGEQARDENFRAKLNIIIVLNQEGRENNQSEQNRDAEALGNALRESAQENFFAR